MTIGALAWRWLIEEHDFPLDHPRFLVTFVTDNFRMAPRQREVRARVVIKS